jgi:hypothetical protein
MQPVLLNRATPARSRESGAAGGAGRVVSAGIAAADPLACHPGVEFLRGLGHHLEHHAGVLGSAELGAGPAEGAGDFRLEPERIMPAGKDVALSGELGNPEAVQHVHRGHPQVDRLANRDMHLVRGNHPQIGVAELPPPLMADHLDLDHIAGGIVRGLEDGLDRGHRDRGENERGNDGPGHFQKRAAVGLPRLRIVGPAPELEDREEERALDQHEHQHRPPHRGPEEVVHQPGKVAPGSQGGLGIVLGAAEEDQEADGGGEPRQAPEGAGARHHQ